AVGERADVQVATVRRRIVGPEVGPQHVGEGEAELAARGRVADHRGDDVRAPLERVHRADGGRLFAGPQPGLGNDPGAYPALQLDVVQPGAQQARVEGDLVVGREARDERGARGDLLDRLPEATHQCGVGLP